MHLVSARGGGAVQICDGARRSAEGNAQEVHLRGDATLQAAERGRVNAAGTASAPPCPATG